MMDDNSVCSRTSYFQRFCKSAREIAADLACTAVTKGKQLSEAIAARMDQSSTECSESNKEIAKCNKSFVTLIWDKVSQYQKQHNKNPDQDCRKRRPRTVPPAPPPSPSDCEEKKPKRPSCRTDVNLPRCCVIKEQNPMSPPCCRDPEEDICPPGCQQSRRVPICGCDACHKSGFHGACYDQTRINLDSDAPPIFEKA